MNLLIHDMDKTEWEKVAADYEGWKIIADNGEIKPCVGCFGCWLRTPGECAIKDGYDQMGKSIHEADEVVIMSKYTYGGFSSFVKNVMDRSIGYILPYFRMYKGEMHHKPRYKESKPISVIFRGNGLTDGDKEKARQYVEAVITNLNAKVKEIRFVECEEVVTNKSVSDSSLEVVKGKTVLVNCSMRGDNANSKTFLDILASKLEGETESINLSEYIKKYDELVSELKTAEKLVFVMPLYVDGVPSAALKLMEMLEKEHMSGEQKVYTIANMGFYESRQIRNLLSMVKEWCLKNGAQYNGGLAIGAGAMMGSVIRFGSNGPAKHVFDNIEMIGNAINKNEAVEDIYADAYKFPRFLYLLSSNSRMKKAANN